MRRNIFICFIGIDGSGKTTLAEILADAMKRSGIKSKYAWCGWRQFDSFLLRPFAAIMRGLLIRRESASVDRDISIERVENRFLFPILRYLMLLDYLISVFPKVKIPLMRGQSIVSDRYIYDLIVESMINHKTRGNAVLNLLPKPDFTFLIDLPEEIAYERKTDIPSVDFLRQKRQLYLDVATQRIDKEKLLVIDGSEDIGRIEELICSRVASILEDSRDVSGISK